ncbi:MAG: hypothetical protein UHS50_09710, partial [Bacteroidaceae bacterium]|nr:hypothetical protein [Bacteroidaceae bacterium]
MKTLRRMLPAILLMSSVGLNAQKPITPPKGGIEISDEFLGIFFEDISSSADGGLYAELVQNGSFEYNPNERDGWGPSTAWRYIRPGHSLGKLEIRMTDGIHPNNPTYMRIHTERVGHYYDFSGWTGYGLQNDGFEGFSVKAGAEYNFSAFLRNVSKGKKKMRIALVEPQGWGKDPKLLAESLFDMEAANWKKYEATLTPNADCKNAVLYILSLTEGTIDADMVSLMPQDTYKGHG